MQQRSSIVTFVSLLLLASSMSFFGLGKFISASNAVLQNAIVSVSPSSVTVPTNQNFTISVIVSEVSDLYGYEYELEWNSTLLDAVNVSESTFLEEAGNTSFTYTMNATLGIMIVDCFLTGNVTGVNGNGTLGIITFYVKSVGECPLDLRYVALLDSSKESIDCQIVSGQGHFIYPHDVAVTSVIASPITLLLGDIVNINATVENKGAFSETFNVTVYANSEIIGNKSVSLSTASSAIIPFTWNTTSFGKGDYTISASASTVPGEVSIADNTRVADNLVTILYNGHDIAVIGIKPNPIVGQGYSASIIVTVKDYGIFTESFNVTIHANITAIQTQNSTLASGTSSQITFTWNTTGFARGNYTIWAYAWPVQDETYTKDNNCSDGSVLITKVGDIGSRIGSTNVFGVGDDLITSDDLQLLLQCYKGAAPAQWMYLGDLGSRVGSTNEFFVCDGLVTGTDLQLFLQCYRGTGP
jgi:hypothetical protein